MKIITIIQKIIDLNRFIIVCGLAVLLCQSQLFAIAVGNRVQADGTVNVRQTAAGTQIGQQTSGSQGTVVGGPTVASLSGVSYTWWNVNFDSGHDGWVAHIGLALVNSGTVDVQPRSVTRSPSNVEAGGQLEVSWQIRNNGSASAASSRSQVRITSSSSSWGNSGNNVGNGLLTGAIAGGATINQNTTITVPSSLTPGTYYVWVVADNTSLLNQTDVNNDYAVSSSFTLTGGTVDVQPRSVTRSPSNVEAGGQLEVSWQIRNNGSASAASSRSQVRITSSSSSWGNSGNNVGNGLLTGAIAGGATINQNTTITVPSSLAPGTYYVWVVADNTSLLNQTDVNNDYAASSSFTVTGGTVDVQPLNVARSPSNVEAGGQLEVSWQIRNNGSASAASSRSQVRITSSSSSWGNSGNNVGNGLLTGAIAGGATINQSTTITVPSSLAPGTYYVWVVADNTSLLNQTDVNNDYAVSASFNIIGGTVDVQPLSVTRGSSNVEAGSQMAVSWQIRNNGSASAATSHSQVRITSSSSSWGNGGNNVGSAVLTGTIAGGATINQNTTITVPSALAPGTYYVWVVADNTSLLNQTDVNNDYAVSSSFTVDQVPDENTDGFDYPIGSKMRYTHGSDGDGWYVAQAFEEWNETFSKYHLGEDWNAETGGSTDCNLPVYSIANGTIVFADVGTGWGRVLIIRHTLPNGSQVESLYGHLESFTKTSGNVVRGEQIGTIGDGSEGGTTYSCHLHLELRTSDCPSWGLPGPGYSTTQNSLGWIHPSDFINANRPDGPGETVDIQPLNVTRGSNNVEPGSQLEVSWQIRNNGSASAASSRSQVRITSSSSSWGNSGNNVGNGLLTGAIAGGATINQNTTITVPSSLAPGTYYVWVVADNTSLLNQTDVNNDYAVSSSFTFTVTETVDVQPLNVTRGSGNVDAGDQLEVGWQIRNNGSASAATSESQVRITSSSSSWGNGNNNVGSAVLTGAIAAGTTINQNTTITVPSTLAPGTYYVWVVADNTSLLNQTDVNNDYAVSASFTVGTPPQGEPASLGVLWFPSPNFENRPPDQVIDTIVLHTVEGSYESGINTLTDNNVPLDFRVSSHYIISPSGEITQLVELNKRAWHATYYNDRAIGIEMAGFAGQASTWNENNLAALENLVAYLVAKYGIQVVHPSGDASTYPQCRFNEVGLIGHSQLQPGCNGFATKSDPGHFFPWESFIQNIQAKLNRPVFTGIGGGRLQAPAGGRFGFEISAPGIEQLTIQASDDLVNWEDVEPVTFVDGKAIFTDTAAGLHLKRFYRPKP